MRLQVASVLLLICSAHLSNSAAATPNPPLERIGQNRETTAQSLGSARTGSNARMPGSSSTASTMKAPSASREGQATGPGVDTAEKRWWPPSSSWALVYATLAYLVVAFCQWRAIHRQATIANKTLALSNRPKLKVRAFVVKSDIGNTSPGKIDWEMEIAFEVANYGGTDAHVTESNCTIVFSPFDQSSELPMTPPYEATNELSEFATPGTVLRAGQYYPFVRTSAVPPPDRERFKDQLKDRAVAAHFIVHVLGYIGYRGAIGNHYRTAFCRRLERHMVLARKFVAVTDADYEYED